MTICSDEQAAVLDLILASTSPYRRQQLTQFGLSFSVRDSAVDEVCLDDEPPVAFALRMAKNKAEAVASDFPDAWVIGADQVCEFENQIIRKPGNHLRASQQLANFSGKTVLFHSALSVVHLASGGCISSNTLTKVCFKNNSQAVIEHYLHLDQPYDCAGSFKIESQGLRLMHSVESTDPSALVGLPLIALCSALTTLGYPKL
ncbi:Maf family protein [Marinicella rhabdoformis]|uniref:Maf family protein n=1 Tax=Marinicella rhabdoformis TaxID=2580566 RepID=UPI0012AED582|nr:Maf family nucleotide pyrophosphatase [Marinicella rhabdoformis]